MHRNIASLGLATDYAQDISVREQCRQLMALSLMPISEVEKQFKRIRTISSSSLDDLFVYFERQWMNGSIPLSMWNSNDADHRTNNISEGTSGMFRWNATKVSADFVLFLLSSIQSSLWNTCG